MGVCAIGAACVAGSPRQQARLREAGMTARDIQRDPELVMQVTPPTPPPPLLPTPARRRPCPALGVRVGPSVFGC